MKNIKVDIINLEHRTDRKIQVLNSLTNIEDLKVDESNIFKAHNDEINGALGCAISHFSVISDFIKNGNYHYQIIFEDDIEFRKKFKITELISSLTGRFDCFLFAHNTALFTENLSGGFVRAINAQTASGYILTREFAPLILEKFAESINGMIKFRNPSQKNTVNHFFAIDQLWKQLQLTHRFVTTNPAMGFQRPSYSDIEMKDVDYGV